MPNFENEKIERIRKSNCCTADVFVNYGDEGTNCYLCKKCLQPCDLIIEKTKTNALCLTSGNIGIGTTRYPEEFNKIVYVKLSEKEMNERIKYARDGNVQAKLDIIMHNQFVINEKLNKILEK